MAAGVFRSALSGSRGTMRSGLFHSELPISKDFFSCSASTENSGG